LGCKSYPHCSYTVEYDGVIEQALQVVSARLAACEARVEALEHLQAPLAQVVARLTRMEAHEAWLLLQVEQLAARLGEQEVPPCP